MTTPHDSKHPAECAVESRQLEGEPAPGDRLRHHSEEDRRTVEIQHGERSDAYNPPGMSAQASVPA
jgi:hypothetical protein